MSTQTLLHLFLTLHLIALTLAVGATTANAFALRQFWKIYDVNPEHGIVGFKGIRKFQVVGGIGLLLLIISGVVLLALYHFAYGPQLWFRIKMICLLLIFVNALSFGRIASSRLGKLINQGQGELDITRLRKSLSLFHVVQLSLFAIIIVLASFRFV